MSRRIKAPKRTCRGCGAKFHVDPRKREQHWYCDQPECRRASKKSSQRRWLAKPENRHYFAGAAGKQRVYEWRQKYPNRRKRGPKAAPVKAVLQDLIDTQRIERLKELCPQEPVLQEMIDHLAGWLLQQGHLTQQGGRSDGHPTSVGS